MLPCIKFLARQRLIVGYLLTLLMSSKRKISKGTGNSQAEVGEVLPTAKWLTKRPRPDELFNDDEHPGELKSSYLYLTLIVRFQTLCIAATRPETQPIQRRSVRTGRGCGGSVQQLERIEHIQSAKPSQQSTCNLDIATEGQEVNTMAPSHHSGMVYDDEESQIPPWAESSPLTQVQPTFALLQSGRFGFQLPSQPTTTSFGDTASKPGMRSNHKECAAPLRCQ
jgi:hypothetical protein